MAESSLNYAPLYVKYPLRQRLQLIFSTPITKILFWFVFFGLVVGLAPMLLGLFGSVHNISEFAAALVFGLIFFGPFIVMCIILIRIFSDRAVKGDKIRNFAYVNGFSYDQYISGNIDSSNPFWDEDSANYLDFMRGMVNGKQFYYTTMVQFERVGIGRRRVSYAGILCMSDVSAESLERLRTEYSNVRDIKQVGLLGYVMFENGISLKPSDYEKFFRNIEKVTQGN